MLQCYEKDDNVDFDGSFLLLFPGHHETSPRFMFSYFFKTVIHFELSHILSLHLNPAVSSHLIGAYSY